MQTDYQKQGTDFLEKHKLKFRATVYPIDMQDAPEWSENKPIRTKVGMMSHGLRYRVTFTRMDNSKTLAFDFWGSIHDRELLELATRHPASSGERIAALKAKPTAYDVLACISSDVNCPDSFHDFCAEYGDDEDSRKAEALHKRCLTFAKELREFFTAEALNDLQEIQ